MYFLYRGRGDLLVTIVAQTKNRGTLFSLYLYSKERNSVGDTILSLPVAVGK